MGINRSGHEGSHSAGENALKLIYGDDPTTWYFNKNHWIVQVGELNDM